MKIKGKEGEEREEGAGTGREVAYYKEISSRRLKESSQLAEQLICLRSDLEKKSVELLKCQKQNSSYYSEPVGPPDKTPHNDDTALSSRQAHQSHHSELPPEPQTHRPTPYPLLERKSASPTTPEYGGRRDKGGRTASGRPASVHGPKLQPPNVPYSLEYHPHK